MTSKVGDTVANFFHLQPSRSLPKNTLITLAGEDPEYISYLSEGIIEQYHITPQGNKIVVNVFKPPAFFPMSWAINDTPNIYFYETLTDATVYTATRDEAVTFLKENPDVAFDLLSRVYKGTDALLRRVIIASSGVAVNRIIFELLIESYRFADVVTNGRCEVKIKQTTLAARTGLARETVSRELRKLSDSHYLSFTRSGFLLDIPKLTDMLDKNS